MTINELLKRAQALCTNQEDSHALFWLLLELLDYSNSDFILNSNKEVDNGFILKYDNLVNEYLINNIPVQQLVGHSYFYNRRFNVSSDTLIPRPETEELVYKTINYIKDNYKDIKNLNILDLATGSGAIGITLKLELDCNITISDISSKALLIAKSNAKYHNVDIDIINSNWFDNITSKYDVIISNPPYIPISQPLSKKVLNEPLNALYSGIYGTDSYEVILSNIDRYLLPNGFIAFEHGYDQNVLIANLIKKNLKGVKIIQEKDLSNKDRYTFIFK